MTLKVLFLLLISLLNPPKYTPLNMKSFTAAAFIGSALLNGVVAYPQIATEILEARKAEAAAESEWADVEARQANPQLSIPTFNAEKQYVSTSGKYKWVAPGPTDQRGP